MHQIGSHSEDFREIVYWGLLMQICQENSCLIKIEQVVAGTVREDPRILLLTATCVAQQYKS
jgi:hypothetical protein